MLGRVGSHFEPKHITSLLNMAIAQNNIPVVQTLTAQRHTPVNKAIVAMLDDDV